MRVPNDTMLNIHLGRTPEEEIKKLTEIKDAMAASVFNVCEQNNGQSDNIVYRICSEIYREADVRLSHLTDK